MGGRPCADAEVIGAQPTRYSAVLVGKPHRRAADLEPERGRAALRLLPRLLTAEGGEVEVGIAVVELLDAPAEGGVGVEDLVADPQEGADPRPVAAHARRPGRPRVGELGLGAVEDLYRCDPLVDRRVEV